LLKETGIYHWYIKIRIEQVSSIHNCKVNRTSFIIARLVLGSGERRGGEVMQSLGEL